MLINIIFIEHFKSLRFFIFAIKQKKKLVLLKINVKKVILISTVKKMSQ